MNVKYIIKHNARQSHNSYLSFNYEIPDGIGIENGLSHYILFDDSELNAESINKSCHMANCLDICRQHRSLAVQKSLAFFI